MGLELERKYVLTDAVMEAVHTAFGPWQTICMETTYYDTADAMLSAQKITLRRRMENGISICTLKTPAPGGARGEWETEDTDLIRALPRLTEDSGSLVLAKAAQQGIRPLCGAAFTRLACTVQLAECVVEIAMDRGILTGGDRQVPLQELEVELKSGSEHAMEAFCDELAMRYGLQEEPNSKFRRASALVKG